MPGLHASGLVLRSWLCLAIAAWLVLHGGNELGNEVGNEKGGENGSENGRENRRENGCENGRVNGAKMFVNIV